MVVKKMYEVDLYEPVQGYFSNLGFNVHAEVNDCDVAAVKEEQLVIVELKLALNITLLTQAAKRQKITPDVYIAIPKPKYSLRKRKWRDLVHLMRRLELGLIVVSFEGKIPHLQVVHEPGPFDRKQSFRQNKKIRERLIKEVSSRKSNANIGGSFQREVMTAYKENCIQIAYYLDMLGEMSARELRKYDTGDKTYAILYNNFYKWFERVGRGIYGLTDKGEKEYKHYEELVHIYQKELALFAEENDE